MQGSAKFCRI